MDRQCQKARTHTDTQHTRTRSRIENGNYFYANFLFSLRETLFNVGAFQMFRVFLEFFYGFLLVFFVGASVKARTKAKWAG